MAKRTSAAAPSHPVVIEESPLKTFVDRVIVPALRDQFLAEQQAAAETKAS